MSFVVRPGRRSGAVVAALATAVALAPGVAAHHPDPLLGGQLFGQNQSVEYRWRSGQVPPAWMKAAIDAGAQDANDSRRSAAAVFSYDAAGRSLIAYDEPTGCGSLGAACTNRGGAPDYFTMAFRRQGYPFDWGNLRWCQAFDVGPAGCYDAEGIALHEFGHALDLGHHQLLDDESDWHDTVMAAMARSKPRAGYNPRAYGICDVVTLQRHYDVPNTTTAIARCQSLDTFLTIAASDTSVNYREAVTFTVFLRITDVAAAGRLGGNMLSRRGVTLQKRFPGSTIWQDVADMAPAPNSNGYATTQNATATYDWRVLFAQPDDEGVQGAVSGTVRVTVGPCTIGPCPNVVDGHE